jgi:dephospho-CoA kinase
MIIIGITGTNGAGKGTVVEYLVKNLGFMHFSVRDYLNEELAKRGLQRNRDTQSTLANEIRSINGNFFIIEELLKKAKLSGKDCVIESIRNPGEVKFLKDNGALLISVDADQKTRYERVLKRGTETDKIKFQKFTEQEDKEMQNTNPNAQNLKRCIELSDIILYNNSTIDKLYEELKVKIDEIKS